MQILDATILNTALPAMAKDLHQAVLSMQWAVISYTLTLAIFTPISGFIADIWHKDDFYGGDIYFYVGVFDVCVVAYVKQFDFFSCGKRAWRCVDDACSKADAD